MSHQFSVKWLNSSNENPTQLLMRRDFMQQFIKPEQQSCDQKVMWSAFNSLVLCIYTELDHHYFSSLQWHHNGCNGIWNHQPCDCLPNHLFRHRSKKTSKLRATGLCAGISPVTSGEFPAETASNEENVSIWWPHHVMAFYLMGAKPVPEPLLIYCQGNP